MTPPPPTRVLLIEDTPSDVVIVRRVLQEAAPTEFTLESSTRLEEGRQRLARESFDVVLLDLTLPDSFGVATFDQLTQAARGIPIIVLSGSANDELESQIVSRGAQDFLLKESLSGRTLVQAIRHAITRHQLVLALREGEQRLRVLAEQLPAMLWTTDRDLRFTSSRGRELATLDLHPDQVVGMSLQEYFGEDNGAFEPLTMHRRALAGESTSANVHWSGRTYHTHIEPLKDAGGEIVGTIGVALNVTGEQRLRRDVEAAHRIQQHLLPAESPELRGFEIAGACRAAEHCSGDFFDYVPLGKQRLAVVLADVSGHGVGPAIMAASIRAYLRMAAVLGSQVHEMLALGNRLLLSDGESNMFASCFAVSLDGKGRTFRYSAAGHPAYHVFREGGMERLETPCVPIGVRQEEVFPLSPATKLKRGDALLIASDGVFEARSPDGELFGVERAVELVRNCSGLPAREVVERLHSAVAEFCEPKPMEDDLTVIIVKGVSRKATAETIEWDERTPPPLQG